MIFNVPGHIEMIRNGKKTQTRRGNRGIYKVGKDYAIQCKRGVKAEQDIRIVIYAIWPEFRDEEPDRVNMKIMPLSERDAWAEGEYGVEQYEIMFRELNPKWDMRKRWAFKFHVIEVEQ